ncbi:hypothetical protein NDU88_003822 [Pleurodeles waltl]|uniref:Peptidase A2 domain-containing protein n=1 Tax=Pleurodeles waltl TaxID=8319 RepID=A0AAV7MSR2_PLEWA|nr:hypothetical protein NDU88_003822 [Pleurodeles waltl]
MSKCCRHNTGQGKVNEITGDCEQFDECDEGEEVILQISNKGGKGPHNFVNVEGQNVRMLFDLGAKLTIIPKDVFLRGIFSKGQLFKRDIRLTGYGGQPIKFVVEMDKYEENKMSMKSVEGMKAKAEFFKKNSEEREVKVLCKEFPEAFEINLVCLKGHVQKIKVKEVKPVVFKVRKVLYEIRDDVMKELMKLEEN